MNIQCFFYPFPVLELGDIILREINAEQDGEAYYKYMTHPEMSGFLTKDNIPASEEKSVVELQYWQGLFHKKQSIYWAIAEKNDNKMIGTIGFNVISFANSRSDVSYDLDPNYWGKGVMLKSLKSVLNFADTYLQLVRIQATVIHDNHRSIKLLERCGFMKEGFLPKYELVDDEHKDYFMYGRVV